MTHVYTVADLERRRLFHLQIKRVWRKKYFDEVYKEKDPQKLAYLKANQSTKKQMREKILNKSLRDWC